jgi:uncharacterized protein (DUF362 family)
MTFNVACVNASEKNAFESVERAIDLLGGIHLDTGSVILIKPNLTSDKKPADSGATTHVTVVDGIIRYINDRAKNCQFLIAESDSDGKAAMAFDRLGFRNLESSYDNVRLIDLSHSPSVKLLVEKSVRIRSIEVAEELLNVHYYINVANFKRHINERFSASWKNSWGIPSNHLARIKNHPFLSEVLYDFNTAFKPDLCVVDALVGLGGPGPIDGFPKKVGKILAGMDSIAVDVAVAKLMGEDPKKSPVLEFAMKKNHRKTKDVNMIGDPWEPIELAFVPWWIFLSGRIGLRFRKLGLYLENIGYLASIAGYALRVGNPTELLGGSIQSVGTTLSTARDLITHVDIADRNFG